MKNIETVKLYPLRNVDMMDLKQYYDVPIPLEFKNTAVTS